MAYIVTRIAANQPGIVHLDAPDLVHDNEPAPFAMDRLTVGQEGELSLDLAGVVVGFFYAQAEAILSMGRVETFQNSAKPCEV